MTTRYWEFFEVGQKETFGRHEATEENIIEFAEEFDPQFFHTDPEAAKNHFFGGLVSSGWQTASVLMRMIVDGQLKNSTSMGSPGVDELRWIAPVRPGEILHATSEVVDAYPHKTKSDRGYVQFSHAVLNQDNEIKLSMTSRIIFGRAPSEGEG